jgi:LPPG:FO 2-phospho-L-lactate transferase
VALARAEAVVIGPSNPVISIGPILSIPGMRELITGSGAPVVAVSPFVAGEVVKGPTDPLMRAVGRKPPIAGIAEAYEGLLAGLVVDAADPSAAPEDLPTASVDTLMDGPEARSRVAREVLAFARSLA